MRTDVYSMRWCVIPQIDELERALTALSPVDLHHSQAYQKLG